MDRFGRRVRAGDRLEVQWEVEPGRGEGGEDGEARDEDETDVGGDVVAVRRARRGRGGGGEGGEERSRCCTTRGMGSRRNCGRCRF